MSFCMKILSMCTVLPANTPSPFARLLFLKNSRIRSVAAS
jgi:hypothetical protein